MLNSALIVLSGALAVFWLAYATHTILGMRRMPRLANVGLRPDEGLPLISVLVSARDEAEKMPPALRSLLALDYPNYEVVIVDDRSTDATPQILREFAAACKRLHAVRVDALPPGWLGKPHGLETAYEHSRGEWLVFTDADVRFDPSLLRRAMSLALERGWDHLTAFPLMETSGFGERALLTYFALGGFLYSRPWSVSRHDSKYYCGVGAFQLVRRSAYEAMGTHRRLAMEVVDDMKLGKLIKESGFSSGVALTGELLNLRWHSGVANIIRGTEKNFFAASGFSWSKALAQIAFLLVVSVLPFALLVAPGTWIGGAWSRIFGAIAVAAVVALHARVARVLCVTPLYGLTHPLGALLVSYMLARSAVITLRQNGIYWRGTFYPLEQLRKGAV